MNPTLELELVSVGKGNLAKGISDSEQDSRSSRSSSSQLCSPTCVLVVLVSVAVAVVPVVPVSVLALVASQLKPRVENSERCAERASVP